MKVVVIQFTSHWFYSQHENHRGTVLRILEGTGMGVNPSKHQVITFQEKLMCPGKFPNQSNSVTYFFIRMKGQWNLNSALASAIMCTKFF